jgi:prevent-host-death family protein
MGYGPNVNRRFTIALLGCQSLALAITPPGLPRQLRRGQGITEPGANQISDTPTPGPETRPNVVASAESAMADVVASQVSVRDLKTHLSEWLARAQSGEVVEVTSHRKPIARITAVKPADSGITSPLQKAIDAGLISWNGQKPNLPPPVKLRGQGKLLSDIVIEDRG